ncbi:MAG: antitoxin [Solirubrobacteraceae bacterium]
MRTTVTLDPDTQLLVQRAMREREMTFKQAINSAIRSGLAGPSERDRPAATIPRDMGAPLVDMTRAIQLAGELEDAEIVRKLAEGR